VKLLIVRNNGEILDFSGMFDVPPPIIRIPVPRRQWATNFKEAALDQINTDYTQARPHSRTENTIIYIEETAK
jgi:hypothetical protein